jgi:acetolactate synthase I/II/III large subunit
MGELTTVRDLNLPVIIIVFADASLALIEMKQRALGYANTAVDFLGTDYEKLARALGGDGYQSALAQSLQAERFSVVSCEFPRAAYDGRI